MNETVRISELFAEVLGDPEADAPRLAYAAACDAAGDRDRADFIRLQIGYRDYLRSGSDRGLHDVRREIELKGRHGSGWAGPIKDRVKWYLFFRGFVEQVALDATDFIGNADELYRLAPVRRVSLTGVAPVMEQLFRSPHLARIVSLTMERQQLGDHCLELLAASPYLSRLEWLDIGFNEVTRAGVEALASSTDAPSAQERELLREPHIRRGERARRRRPRADRVCR